MKDYSHFPRVIRTQVSDRQLNAVLFVVLALLVLFTFSVAGREDMAAQVVIDKAALLERTKVAVTSEEQAALYFYNQQARK